MHGRRLACFFLGLWLAGGLLVAWVATQNLRLRRPRTVRRQPGDRHRLKPFGQEAEHDPLAFTPPSKIAGFFVSGNRISSFFGTFFFCVMLFGSREDKFTLLGVLVMLLLVALQRFLLTPELIALGRLIDFAPLTPTPQRTGSGSRTWRIAEWKW